MKKIVFNLIKYSTCTVTSIGLAITTASANQFYSPAPTPASIQEVKGTSYITSNANGTAFYGASPYYSQQTTDGNLFVSSIIVMQDRRTTLGTYVQIDCGRRIYRDLVPWYEMDKYGTQRLRKPMTYNWTYFKLNSAFEQVGKSLCTNAARDRALDSSSNILMSGQI
jgi:hypothetical protein